MAIRHLKDDLIPILYQYTFPNIVGPAVRLTEDDDIEEGVKSRIAQHGRYLLNESLQMLAMFYAYSADLDESLVFDRGKLKSSLDKLTNMINDTQLPNNIPTLFNLFRQTYVIGDYLYAERSAKNKYKAQLNFKPTDKQGIFPIEDEVVDILWIMQQNDWFKTLQYLLVEGLPYMPTELMDQIIFYWLNDKVRSELALGAYTYTDEVKLNAIFTGILNNRNSIIQSDLFGTTTANEDSEAVQKARCAGLR